MPLNPAAGNTAANATGRSSQVARKHRARTNKVGAQIVMATEERPLVRGTSTDDQVDRWSPLKPAPRREAFAYVQTAPEDSGLGLIHPHPGAIRASHVSE